MKVEAGDLSAINLSVQQVLSLWAHGTVLRSLTEMWYWVFLWALFSSLFVHGAVGVLMFVMLQKHRQGRLISVIVVCIGFLGSITGAMITSKAHMEPVENLTLCCSSWNLQSSRKEYGSLRSSHLWCWTDSTDINYLIFKDSCNALRLM